MELRKFTDKGLERFRAYLHELGGGAASEPPQGLLADPECAKPVGGRVQLERTAFDSRLALARYLDRTLEDLPERPDALAGDVHLWSWMSLFYFDQVCPANDKGRRRPGRDYRHIPEPGYPHGHRHLLMGAYLVYTVYEWGEELSKLLLHSVLSVENHFHHEIATRQSFITNRGVMEALHLLYFDDARNRPKRGPIMNRRAPGSLYRFIDVVQQLDVTYDLYSMSGHEIVGLLPAEFALWPDKQLRIQAKV
ncbi:MAG: hypothetical protein MUD16_10305 [Desulfobacterales bacterium]|jgi:hypothetical protein|nr:hypothetical protein [Desulfobacterales bacterium]